jgi:exodeoxyribonuclease VII small subunit
VSGGLDAGKASGTGEQLTFEEAQAELERIVERLERGDVGLEELARLWERGEELYRRCAGELAAAQGKIEELAKRLEEGEPAA